MKHYRVVHTTEYQFNKPVRHCTLQAMLGPLETACQHVDHFQIVTRPHSFDRISECDAFGNTITRVVIHEELRRLVVSAVSTLRVSHGTYSAPLENDAGIRKTFQAPTAIVTVSNELAAYGKGCWNENWSTVMAADRLNQQIFRDIAFKVGVTDTHTTAAQVLNDRRGVCQDFAHLAIGVLRSMGIPARYVSGYVYTAGFRGKSHRIAADASHAWFEVFDEELGWVGFDPANGRRVDGCYITVARGRDYDDVCPLQGSFTGGGGHGLRVSVDVQQIQ